MTRRDRGGPGVPRGEKKAITGIAFFAQTAAFFVVLVFAQAAQTDSAESGDLQVLHGPRKKVSSHYGGFYRKFTTGCPMVGALATWLLNRGERPQQALEGIKNNSSIKALFGLRALVA